MSYETQQLLLFIIGLFGWIIIIGGLNLWFWKIHRDPPKPPPARISRDWNGSQEWDQ